MLEWLYALGFVLVCIAAALDARARAILAKRQDSQEQNKATPKRRQKT